jgi:hypothetical protein
MCDRVCVCVCVCVCVRVCVCACVCVRACVLEENRCHKRGIWLCRAWMDGRAIHGVCGWRGANNREVLAWNASWWNAHEWVVHDWLLTVLCNCMPSTLIPMVNARTETKSPRSDNSGSAGNALATSGRERERERGWAHNADKSVSVSQVVCRRLWPSAGKWPTKQQVQKRAVCVIGRQVALEAHGRAHG